MQISVHSETAKLKHVLLHRPGEELEQLTPARLEPMLFDDIPYIHGAQREHDAFADALKSQGVEVHYLTELAAEALSQDEGIKRKFVEEFIHLSGPAAVYNANKLLDRLLNIESTKDMVIKTMAGITLDDIDGKEIHPLSSKLRHESSFVTLPMPNLYFTRDPMACIGKGAVLSSMYAASRKRETLYSKYILKYHPQFKKPVPFYYDLSIPYPIEGGDILCPAKDLLIIGISQRTSPEAIEILAKHLFTDEDSGFTRILALDIPKLRAYMHLDTVMTQVDTDSFTVHPGLLRDFRAFTITMGAKNTLDVTEECGTMDTILAKTMGQDKINLIPCGGDDEIAAQREQWNDASNTLCIAPGVVIVYDRNAVTNAIIRDAGIRTIEIPGSELGRGRGGPRCMTMPLERQN
ncbi:MAG: arginine deiminase [Eubacteriales bacterium]|nr:arginine deiminase [Eubacteriales bacterium]